MNSILSSFTKRFSLIKIITGNRIMDDNFFVIFPNSRPSALNCLVICQDHFQSNHTYFCPSTR